MARPPKTGLEYFPLDVDIAEDEKILYLESETGLEGFAVYVKLLATIYRSGYYIMWTETQLGIYSRRFFVDKNTLSAVVSVYNNSPDAGVMSAETTQSKVKNNNVVVVTRAGARDIEEGNT